MGSLAEGATETTSQTNLGFTEPVAESIGRGESVFPALLAVAFQQIDLRRFRGKG